MLVLQTYLPSSPFGTLDALFSLIAKMPGKNLDLGVCKLLDDSYRPIIVRHSLGCYILHILKLYANLVRHNF